MDTTLVTELLKLGLLGVAVVWFARRDDRNQEASATREAANQKRSDEREQEERRRCDASIGMLAKRLDNANDRHSDEQRDLLRSSMETIKAATVALVAIIEVKRGESGMHRTQQGDRDAR